MIIGKESNEKAVDFKSITNLLQELNIKYELLNVDVYGYSGGIKFKISETIYLIKWWVNESILYIGESERSAQIPFRYIYLDTTYPIIGGNKSIGFAYNKYIKETIVDREFPYAIFRIPI